MTYKVYLSTKIKAEKLAKGYGIIVIEPDDYSSKEIKAIEAKGYTVLGYISVGTIEKERPWFNKYKKYALKRLKDWPNEYFADLTKKEWRNFLVTKAKGIKNKGCDGWWADNIDVYEYYPSIGMFNGVCSALESIKKLGGYLMINGGSRFLKRAFATDRSIPYINGYTQEEVFSRIISYSGKGKFGKQTDNESKYYKSVIELAKKAKIQTFLLEYTRDEKVKESIRKYYSLKKCSGYYIAKDVNL